MEEALDRFHRYRVIFETCGVRPNGFALPHQHALVHYVRSIRLFGSPSGLCSSITESKHITAVKRPWRRSSRHNPLKQIIRINTRLAKLAAIRVKFVRCGMLNGDIVRASLAAARRRQQMDHGSESETESSSDVDMLDDEQEDLDAGEAQSELADEVTANETDALAADSPAVQRYVSLSTRPGMLLSNDMSGL